MEIIAKAATYVYLAYAKTAIVHAMKALLVVIVTLAVLVSLEKIANPVNYVMVYAHLVIVPAMMVIREVIVIYVTLDISVKYVSHVVFV